MERIGISPRPDWQAKADALGFDWHTVPTPDDPVGTYWDESAWYGFTLQQAEEIEAAAETLHAMCLDFVGEAVKSERIMERLAIPEAHRDYVADTWTRGDPSLYGRFDFAYDGKGPPKLYEYNADTPTSIFETAVFQWAHGRVPIAFCLLGGYLSARLDRAGLVRLHRLVIAAAALSNAGLPLTPARVLELARDERRSSVTQPRA